MHKIKMLAFKIVLVSILLAGASFFIPVPDAAQDREAFNSTFAFLILINCLNLGSCLLFLLGLKGFTTAFRRTYFLICGGLIAQAIGSVVYLVALYTGTLFSPGATIMAELPLAFGIIVIFFGLVTFARLLRMASWLTNIWLVGLVATVLAAATWLLPHSMTASGELWFDIGHALLLTEILFYVFSTLILIKIRDIASSVYAASLTWFIWYVASTFVAASLLFGYDYIQYPDWLTLDVLAIPYVIGNVFTLISGYMFNRINRIPAQSGQHTNVLIDSIIFLASLPSKPQEIEGYLDTLRGVTAKYSGNQPLGAEEVEKLKEVYRSLRNYLVTEEHLRSFTAQQLDDLVRERFNISLT